MIHARRQPKRYVTAIAVRFDKTAIAQQVFERIGKALGLIKLRAGDFAAGADDGITGADKDIGTGVDRARTILQFAREAIVHAAELRPLRLPQVEAGKLPPNPDRKVADDRLFDAAEPADELSREAARNAVGQEEIDILLFDQAHQLGTDRHGTVNSGT